LAFPAADAFTVARVRIPPVRRSVQARPDGLRSRRGQRGIAMFFVLRSLLREKAKGVTGRQSKVSYRPSLEALEDRTVPALLAPELAAALHISLPAMSISQGFVTSPATPGTPASAFVFGIAHHTSSDKNPYVLLGIRSTNEAALQAFVDSRPEHAHHPHLGPFTFTNSIGDTYQIFTHEDFVVRIPAQLTQAQAQKLGLVPDASFFSSLGVSVSPSSSHALAGMSPDIVQALNKNNSAPVPFQGA
jgi:hypothetical protein